MANIKEIMKNQLNKITPSKEEFNQIENVIKELVKDIAKKIKKSRLKAEVFIGGSYAKNTLIKKNKYDIDVFIRFDKKYDDKEISSLLKKLVPKIAVKKKGSRDYFSLKKGHMELEIIPVFKINKPEEAKNITDLSYFHVNYIKNKIRKNKKLSGEIRLAKAFCYYSECYGAESYINGFSGYALELLIVYYKSFLSFIRAVAKQDIKKKIIIDIERKFKNKNVEIELNESKISSPIILIDPTYKERNAMAALSYATFIKFQRCCKEFLKNPSPSFFQFYDKERELEERYKNKLIKRYIKTDRQAGDIAGTKLKKFYNFFIKKAEQYFEIKSYFVYKEEENMGIIYIVVLKQKPVVYNGPPMNMKEEMRLFKKKHKKVVIKKGKAYAYEKPIGFNEFVKKTLETAEEMGVCLMNNILASK